MKPPIPLEEAWDRLFAIAPRLPCEEIPADKADGRVLVDPLRARRTQPNADLSAMDGFAVAGPGPWQVVGESRAGSPFSDGISAGEATRISTGATVPRGAHAIVPVEDASFTNDLLAASHPENSRYIRRRGFDFAEGDSLLGPGTPVGPAQLALARAAGYDRITVSRQPVVTVIECGDELSGDAEDPGVHRIPASNGAMVAAMARSAGALARKIGPLPDSRESLARAIFSASEGDVIVTTAGASVGEHDHVLGALEDCGATIDFWRVAIRPGKPLLVGRLANRIVIGLPGNPASSYVTAFLFLIPLLRTMQGVVHARPEALPLPLGASLPQGGARREFLRGRWFNGSVHPLAERDSSALRTLASANVLIDRPMHVGSATPGALVPCYLMDGRMT